MKARVQGSWAARLVGRFLRHERGSITPIFALMLIPLVGVMAMAVEVSNGVLMQRVEQHAADSSVLAAASGNDQKCYPGGTVAACSTAGTNYGYVLEAKSAALQYSIGNSSVTPELTDCPGSNTGAKDCYKVTVSRTVPLYLASMVGVRNISPTAIAYARTSVSYDLCFATSGDFTTDGTSTGFSTCYVESFAGKIKCTSVTYAGLFTNNTQACGSTPTSAPSTKPTCPTVLQGVNPCLSSSIPGTGAVACQSAGNASDPTKWTWTPISTSYTPSSGTAVTSTTNYVRLCGGTVTMAGNWNIAATANNQAIILDNTTISGGGTNTLKALGTTIISTCSSACATMPVPISNLKNANGVNGLTVGGPKQDTGTFANFALYDDETKTTAGALTFSFNIDVDGEIYEPNRDLSLNGSQSSDIGGVSCVTLISKTFSSNGGKLINNPIGDCAGNYLTAQQTVANVALVR